MNKRNNKLGILIGDIKYKDFPTILTADFLKDNSSFTSFEEMEKKFSKDFGKKLPRKLMMDSDDFGRDFFISEYTSCPTWAELVFKALREKAISE